jgi:hypothetical protein
LAYGGTRGNVTDPIENILPFAFPFGLGGPKMNQRVEVSLQPCNQLYMQLTRYVISAATAQLIPSNGGSHFVFTHDYSDLLVGQMEATLEGQGVNVCIRTNKLPDGQF